MFLPDAKCLMDNCAKIVKLPDLKERGTMMRGLFLRSAVVGAIAVGLSFMAGCFQGPTGPAGKDGKSVVDTLVKIDTIKIIDSSFIRDTIFNLQANCAQCHANNQLIVAKQYEWETTKHDTGSTWRTEGAEAACMACHNGSAFIFTLTKADSANVLANPTNANCRTCHMIHTNYDTTDFRLVGGEKPVTAKFNGSLLPDYGAGNLCTNCHQLRTSFMADVMAGTGTESINPNNTITSTATMVGTDSIKFAANASRASNHYGAQAQIIAGAGLWLPNGGASLNYPSAHRTAVADGCVQCHLGPNNVHTYKPEIASCNAVACHPGPMVGPAGPFDIDSVQTKVIVLEKAVRDSLISRNIATWDSTKVFPDPTGLNLSSAAKGKTFPVYVVGAFINLQTIMWDGSKGVHNIDYVEGLLNGSLVDLRK
jgi:hypothetical protein